jgi:hypothetical protein
MFRYLIFFIVLLFSTPVMADKVSLGGTYVSTAHSDSTEYCMNNEGDTSWGAMLSYHKDMGWKTNLTDNNIVGIDPGLSYNYINWNKTYNKWDDEGRKYRDKTESVNSHIVAAVLRPYWKMYNKFSVFVEGAYGLELSDDGNDNAAYYGGGLEYKFNDSFGVSVATYTIYSNPNASYKRWETVTTSFVWEF